MATPRCPVCKKNPAYLDPYWGYIPCLPCLKKQSMYRLPSETVEMTTPQIKEDRVKYSKEIVQPFRNGELSKEYLEANGSKGIKATKQQIKKAKYVWRENEYYKKS